MLVGTISLVCLRAAPRKWAISERERNLIWKVDGLFVFKTHDTKPVGAAMPILVLVKY